MMDTMNDTILGDRAGWHGTLAGASSGMLFKTHKLLVSGIFHLIVLDYSSPKANKTTYARTHTHAKFLLNG